MKESDLLNNLLFISGPPRSGTKIAAMAVNVHPRIVTAIDDNVYECWGLYYYRTREGIIQDIREGIIDADSAQNRLIDYLTEDGYIAGVAPSKKTGNLPSSSAPRPSENADRTGIDIPDRCKFPIEMLRDRFLCLKSPEISFVIPQMSAFFPESKFIFVYRSILEIADSMYRIARKVKKILVYHRRWELERDDRGQRIPPPGVPGKWHPYWNKVTDFQRCVLYGASYLEALASGCEKIDRRRFLVYDHRRFREDPFSILERISHFLNIPISGFNESIPMISSEKPGISDPLIDQYKSLEKELNIEPAFGKMEAFSVETIGGENRL